MADSDPSPHDQEKTGCDQPKPEASENYRTLDGERWWKNRNSWFRIVEIVILAAALGAASAAAYYAKGAADASRDQAEAAWGQIEVAKATARTELRAYLSVESVKTIRPGDDGVFTEIPLDIANSGPTPAYNLALHIIGFAETPEGMKDVHFVIPRKEVTPSDLGFVPGNATRLRSAQIVQSKPTMESLTESGRRLWAGGVIYYDDAFGNDHWVIFCISWSPDDLSPEGATYCEDQNDIDPAELVLQ